VVQNNSDEWRNEYRARYLWMFTAVGVGSRIRRRVRIAKGVYSDIVLSPVVCV